MKLLSPLLGSALVVAVLTFAGLACGPGIQRLGPRRPQEKPLRRDEVERLAPETAVWVHNTCGEPLQGLTVRYRALPIPGAGAVAEEGTEDTFTFAAPAAGAARGIGVEPEVVWRHRWPAPVRLQEVRLLFPGGECDRPLACTCPPGRQVLIEVGPGREIAVRDAE